MERIENIGRGLAMSAMIETTPAMTETEQAITLSEVAIHKLQTLLIEKNISSHGLRVFVAGSGCSGVQYGMAFESEARDQDTVMDAHGLKVYVDPVSLEYLNGASIDYVEGPAGGGFRIENPNALGGCNCGSSSRNSGEASDAGCACRN
jgi:iron-sulfur cluster assembly accessory protein